MEINQRDVYLLPHPINSSSASPHPYIVLSIKDANAYEKTFLAVMMTSAHHYVNDPLSFELADEMFETPLMKSPCNARMHLIMLCLKEEVIGKRLNVMKDLYFQQLMKHIGEIVFNYQFSPLPTP